jgi:histone acetyltransferase 1
LPKPPWISSKNVSYLFCDTSLHTTAVAWQLLNQIPGTLPATEVVKINLTTPSGAYIFPESFQPTFTYAVFGEEEIILGYKALKISLNFRAHDLKPTVSIKYGEKKDAINEQMAENQDVEGKLRKFLPESMSGHCARKQRGMLTLATGAFATGADDEESGNGEANGDSASWTPPGQLLHTYRASNKKYQIWTSPLNNPRTFDIIKNILILIPFFIEGGTTGFLDEPDWSIERWKVFLLYEVSGSDNYTLAGFSTSYRAWVFPTTSVLQTISSSAASPDETTDLPPSSPRYTATDRFSEITPHSVFDLASRERISQFIILPPYQHSSHGSYLYNAMTSVFRHDKWVFEITVEEPNEDFDALRDHCDMAYLNSLPQLLNTKSSFAALTLPDQIPLSAFNDDAPVPTDKITPQDDLERIRNHAKIAPRQFMRLLEIHLLSTLPPRNRSTSRITRKYSSADPQDRRYYFWRLLVKERIFMKNRDQLLQIDEAERVGKVEETLGGVQEEYTERIDGFTRRMARGLGDIVEAFESGGGQANGGASLSAAAGLARRKRKVVEDDEDDDDDEVASTTSKRAKA